MGVLGAGLLGRCRWVVGWVGESVGGWVTGLVIGSGCGCEWVGG